MDRLKRVKREVERGDESFIELFGIGGYIIERNLLL